MKRISVERLDIRKTYDVENCVDDELKSQLTLFNNIFKLFRSIVYDYLCRISQNETIVYRTRLSTLPYNK